MDIMSTGKSTCIRGIDDAVPGEPFKLAAADAESMGTHSLLMDDRDAVIKIAGHFCFFFRAHFAFCFR